MHKIRTYNSISPKGLSRFPRDLYDVSADCDQPDAILLRSQKLHDEVIPASLVAVARAGAGINNLPVDRYTDSGIVVFNTPGANANAVKELVVGALMMASRNIYGGMNYVQELTHIDDSIQLGKHLEKEKKRFAGVEIRGKTLGVVGLGAIGSMIANLALDLGMEVIGHDPAISVEAAWQLSSNVERIDNLELLLRRADFLTLHVPAIPETHQLVNASVLSLIKPTTKILNFAREEVVCLNAILEALDNGSLAGYVTDFPDPKLLGRENALLMPHIGASTAEAEENCAVMAVSQLMDFLENGNIVNSVNFPSTKLVRRAENRITFSNRNVPKVLGNVLGILADDGLNVIDMVNKSRDEIAYNIVDVEGALDASLTSKIASVSGVKGVKLFSKIE
jgi:D-3-phosphoglycerate dehydrogenase